MRRRFALLAPLIVAAAACRPGAVREDVPALLVAPTPAARDEVAAAIASALRGTPISIAPDALTRASLLTLERREPAGPERRTATGRVLGMPERFRLVTDGSRCYLVHESGTARVELLRAECVPE